MGDAGERVHDAKPSVERAVWKATKCSMDALAHKLKLLMRKCHISWLNSKGIVAVKARGRWLQLSLQLKPTCYGRADDVDLTLDWLKFGDMLEDF